MGMATAAAGGGATGTSGVEVSPMAEAAERGAHHTVKREMPKVGRNDPCPCGSGKKYKKCHGTEE
jgi:preprotein translocase subunit SecA